MAAVALEGFAELTVRLREARKGAATPQEALVDVAAAYAGFADQRPALYDAMFTLSTELSFDGTEGPMPPRDAFGELEETIRPLAGERDVEALAETFWSALHGLVMLTRNRRLRPGQERRRLELLVGRFALGPIRRA